jgi:hypothetical protein
MSDEAAERPSGLVDRLAVVSMRQRTSAPAAFPTGDYRLDVSAVGTIGAGDGGTRKFTVASAFRITLVP